MYVTSTKSGAINLYGLLREKFGEQGEVMCMICTRLALPLIVQELPQLNGTGRNYSAPAHAMKRSADRA